MVRPPTKAAQGVRGIVSEQVEATFQTHAKIIGKIAGRRKESAEVNPRMRVITNCSSKQKMTGWRRKVETVCQPIMEYLEGYWLGSLGKAQLLGIVRAKSAMGGGRRGQRDVFWPLAWPGGAIASMRLGESQKLKKTSLNHVHTCGDSLGGWEQENGYMRENAAARRRKRKREFTTKHPRALASGYLSHLKLNCRVR